MVIPEKTGHCGRRAFVSVRIYSVRLNGFGRPDGVPVVILAQSFAGVVENPHPVMVIIIFTQNNV